MKQTWHDLLFAHWPLPHATLRPLVPAQLELDQFDGQCWVGVVPFRMSGVTGRTMPPLPGLSSFPELNVRTYVTHGESPAYISSVSMLQIFLLCGRRESFSICLIFMPR
jgi:uncharacterized protein YqjF (DUF2071 family)